MLKLGWPNVSRASADVGWTSKVEGLKLGPAAAVGRRVIVKGDWWFYFYFCFYFYSENGGKRRPELAHLDPLFSSPSPLCRFLLPIVAGLGVSVISNIEAETLVIPLLL